MSWENRRCDFRVQRCDLFLEYPQFISIASAAVFQTNLPSSNMTPTSMILAMMCLLAATVVDSFFAPSLNVSADKTIRPKASSRGMVLFNWYYLMIAIVYNILILNNHRHRLERLAWRISSSNTKTQGPPQASSQSLDHSHQLSNQLPRRVQEPGHWTYM